MSKSVITAAALGAFVAALGAPATAAAGPLDGSADVVVNNLKSQGYNVQVNGGSAGVPLSRCTVSGVHPSLNESDSLQEKQHTLVTVDLSCPSH